MVYEVDCSQHTDVSVHVSLQRYTLTLLSRHKLFFLELVGLRVLILF